MLWPAGAQVQLAVERCLIVVAEDPGHPAGARVRHRQILPPPPPNSTVPRRSYDGASPPPPNSGLFGRTLLSFAQVRFRPRGRPAPQVPAASAPERNGVV